MGYLDGSTITVDAILTKQGRKLLAEGRALNVSSFCLSDTGIDYNLWNVDHPSGSAYYGEALEDLPQVEALPQAQYFMRNKLITLDKNTTAMPIISGVEDSHIFAGNEPWTVTPKLLNHAGNQFNFLVLDSTLVNMTGTAIDISGTALQFITEQGIINAVMVSGASTTITPTIQEIKQNTTLIIISVNTGAYHSVSLTIPKNVAKTIKTISPAG